MAPVVNGEIIKILIPSSLTNFVHSEAPQDFATSVASMAECFVAAQADFYFSGNNLCYLSSYCYYQPNCYVVLLFVGGASTDSLLTNNGEYEDFLITELQEYLHEAVFDYTRLLGEDISPEDCKFIQVSSV